MWIPAWHPQGPASQKTAHPFERVLQHALPAVPRCQRLAFVACAWTSPPSCHTNCSHESTVPNVLAWNNSNRPTNFSLTINPPPGGRWSSIRGIIANSFHPLDCAAIQCVSGMDLGGIWARSSSRRHVDGKWE